MSRFFRPLARYAAPTAWRNLTGDVETFADALGLSFPRGERPIPITLIVGATALSASYELASSASYAAPETFRPRESNCGCQKRGWFGSLPTMMFFTVGNVRATWSRNATNWTLAPGTVIGRAFQRPP